MGDCDCSESSARTDRIITANLSPAEKRAIAFGRASRSSLESASVTTTMSRPRQPASPLARLLHPLKPAVANPASASPKEIQWAYGVTTVPSRRTTLLPGTLTSLAYAGFPTPRLFIDGCDLSTGCLADYAQFNLPVTARQSPNVRTVGNWILALWELYLRDPQADRYAIFQDDFVTYRNLRQYLEASPYPTLGYWNLYTFPSNQQLVGDQQQAGWSRSNQKGFGAVGLVFDRATVTALLSSPVLINRPQDPAKGHRLIDMCIAEALRNLGYTEFIHNPSLTQHTGIRSSMGNGKHPLAPSFRGEEFDALSMLP